jgi:hypothetical protein
MRAVLSEKASIIGIPEISFTANKDPDKLSVIEKSWPCDPCISRTVEPDALIIVDPLTSRPFLTLNSFGIIYTVFTVQQLLRINIKASCCLMDLSILVLRGCLIFRCRCKALL